MPQIFHRSANTLAKVSIVGVLLDHGHHVLRVYCKSLVARLWLHTLDNPWQESYVASSLASKAEHERVQAPCSRDFQLLAAKQV